jgi:hypothetical protein
MVLQGPPLLEGWTALVHAASTRLGRPTNKANTVRSLYWRPQKRAVFGLWAEERW